MGGYKLLNAAEHEKAVFKIDRVSWEDGTDCTFRVYVKVKGWFGPKWEYIGSFYKVGEAEEYVLNYVGYPKFFGVKDAG